MYYIPLFCIMGNCAKCSGTPTRNAKNESSFSVFVRAQARSVPFFAVLDLLRKEDFMKTSDFAYDLPEELIAQDPLVDRASSRLMLLDKETGRREHTEFHQIIQYLQKGDCLVINDTKVIPARLIGEKAETGGKVEVLLLKRRENNIWETLVKPGKKARPGAKILFGGGLLAGEILDVVGFLVRRF